jgi:hypothetical protein
VIGNGELFVRKWCTGANAWKMGDVAGGVATETGESKGGGENDCGKSMKA